MATKAAVVVHGIVKSQMAEGVKAKKGTKKTGRRQSERRGREKNNTVIIIRISFSQPRTPVYKKIAAGSLPPALKKPGALLMSCCGVKMSKA